MVRRAFWNKYRPGCDEHYLVHILREDSAYLPELSRVAVVDGKVVGCILYSRSRVEEREVVTFGPLCVDPAYQGRGIGGMLLDATLALAKEAGWSGVVIFGEPDYYPLHGFVTCDRFGITTADGGNRNSFMAYRLNDSFDGIHGRFFEAEVFEHLEGAAAYETKFPPMERQRFPQQWPDEKA
ncbi:MAG: N-acetyltransferase [Clostridia bacterium]|nr:N-acetyltransferase [Clostridia bacterium]